MGRQISPTQTKAMQDLTERLKAWRDTGRIGRRIPEALWVAAEDLARQIGVSPVHKQTGLDYTALNRRLAHRENRSAVQPASEGHFVQLPIGSFAPTAQCVIEFTGHQGTQTMRLSGYDAATIITLAQSLSGSSR